MSKEQAKAEPTTGAKRLQEAEEYVKNPSRMDEFTQKREDREAKAKDKAQADKSKNKSGATGASGPSA